MGQAPVDDAVLVDIPQLVKPTDGLRRVPSLVRLQRLQDCSCILSEERKSPVGFEAPTISGDRERDLPSDAWLPEFIDRVRAAGQKPRGVIKGRASVVDEISDDQTEVPWEGISLDTEAHDVASGLIIELRNDTKKLRFRDGVTLPIEGFQLFECPSELGFWPV